MKLFFTLASLTAIFATASATVHTVTCQNSPSHFLPVTLNAVVGDTIHWTWIEGGHIVGPISSSDIPAGAAMWNGLIDAADLTFDYKVTVAGNYHYVCHPATPHGEDAYIVVTDVSGVKLYSTTGNLSLAYPNPFSSKTSLQTNKHLENAVLKIYISAGQFVKEIKNLSGQAFTLFRDNLPCGLYFIRLTQDGEIIGTNKVLITD